MAAPADPSPLASGDPLAWEGLIESVNPPAMLVRIEGRMGALLRQRMSAEDLWQETLLHAWRDRGRHEWRGLLPFRNWLLEVAENRIRDAADREGAQKRGGGEAGEPLAAGSRGSGLGPGERIFASTTPSRHAQHCEQAELLRAALAALPELSREVVRRRLFEEQGLDEIAAALGISHAAVKHRLRKGVALYRERLAALLGTRADAGPGP
jgi:RNA polymerase sigma factor (sigma-70 family)